MLGPQQPRRQEPVVGHAARLPRVEHRVQDGRGELRARFDRALDKTYSAGLWAAPPRGRGHRSSPRSPARSGWRPMRRRGPPATTSRPAPRGGAPITAAVGPRLSMPGHTRIELRVERRAVDRRRHGVDDGCRTRCGRGRAGRTAARPASGTTLNARHCATRSGPRSGQGRRAGRGGPRRPGRPAPARAARWRRGRAPSRSGRRRRDRSTAQRSGRLAPDDDRVLAVGTALSALETQARVEAGEARHVGEAARAPLLVDDQQQRRLGEPSLRDRASARSRPSAITSPPFMSIVPEPTSCSPSPRQRPVVGVGDDRVEVAEQQDARAAGSAQLQQQVVGVVGRSSRAGACTSASGGARSPGGGDRRLGAGPVAGRRRDVDERAQIVGRALCDRGAISSPMAPWSQPFHSARPGAQFPA